MPTCRVQPPLTSLIIIHIHSMLLCFAANKYVQTHSHTFHTHTHTHALTHTQYTLPDKLWLQSDTSVGRSSIEYCKPVFCSKGFWWLSLAALKEWITLRQGWSYIPQIILGWHSHNPGLVYKRIYCCYAAPMVAKENALAQTALSLRYSFSSIEILVEF